MTSNSDLMPDAEQEDAFEVQMRGYSRRQVDEFVARHHSQIREYEERIARSLDDSERLRLELSAARQGLSNKPAHEEISERVGQILKLADDEAKAQRNRAQDDINSLRDDAKKEADRIRAEAREQTERMLTAAQEQAENAIASARAEAEKMRNSARIESERAVSEATKEADTTLASAKAQAKQMLDEATTRASAIHDGAERRLNLLTSRHTETMRRLTEIRDVVTNLVSSETARGSLEEEVAKSVASANVGGAAAANRAAAVEGRHAPATMPGRGGARDAATVQERSVPEPAPRASAAHASRAAEERVARAAATSTDERVTRTAAMPATPADERPAAVTKPSPRAAAQDNGGAHAATESARPQPE